MQKQRPRSMHARYGGVHFTQLVPAEDINDYVRSLPDEKRTSLFDVMHDLNQQGFIRIENDHDWTDPGGEIHPESLGDPADRTE